MNLSCNVIRDLLPLYYDSVCSKESRALVDEHLESCPNCTAILTKIRGEIQVLHEEPDDGAVLKKLGENVKHDRKRAWIRGAAAVLAVVLLLTGVNIYRNRQYQARFAPFFADQEPIRMAGKLETTEIYEAMYDWIHGNYRFRVNVPRPGCQGMILVEEYHWTKDIRNQDLVTLTLSVRFGERGSYLYDISIESSDLSGVWIRETLTIDQNGQTIDDESWDAKTIARKNQALETYRSRILNIIMAVEREWHFLTVE